MNFGISLQEIAMMLIGIQEFENRAVYGTVQSMPYGLNGLNGRNGHKVH